MTPGKTNYTRRFENLSMKQFDEAYAWLGHLGESKFSEGYHFVNFDNVNKLEGEHARVDPRDRTIELTSKLDLSIGSLLEHIIKREIRGDDIE